MLKYRVTNFYELPRQISNMSSYHHKRFCNVSVEVFFSELVLRIRIKYQRYEIGSRSCIAQNNQSEFIHMNML